MTAELGMGAVVSADQWRDKKRCLWLMGLIPPTMLFVVWPIVWAMNQFGWQSASQVFFGSVRSWCTSCCRRWSCSWGRKGRTHPMR